MTEDVDIAQLVNNYISQLVSSPYAKLPSVPLLDPLERHRLLVDWNATQAPYPDHLCVHQLFEQQVGLNPDATALVYEDQSLSYGELNAQANQLAHHLIGLGVQPDDRIAICVERSLEMVVGLIAILKAGGAYVPLDPAYPADRLAFMLADANPQIVLSHGPARQALDAAMAGLAAPPQVVDLIDDARLWTSQPDANPDPKALGLKPTNLAYVIYTSGSTGTPKGVMVEHRNVSRLFASTRGWFDFGSDDVWTLFHSFAFDFSVWEIWGALLHSGRLLVVPHSRARSAKDFYEMVRQAGVTVLNQTPSAFRNLIAAQAEDNRPHALRHVIFGGEALDVAALRPWWERSQNLRTGLVNMYGITETTVHVTYRPLSAADAETSGASPIGRPIGDLRLYLLDDRLEPVPVGVSGEIYIGGAGVARGYLNRPELTAERFIESPFVEGDRLYKTGDLARYLPDGNIVFLGRNDHQVKIRGFRIELGEIEARLLDVDGVRDAVVVAREDTPGDKRLVAYYTGEAGVEAEHLRPALLATLPDYMVPAAYVRLESLPLTPNGKLDRKALPAPEGNAYATRAYEAPVGPVEGALARIWAELLGVEQVGRHDSFFELGGHSLLAVRMISRVRQQLDTEVALAELFAHPGLSAFAARLSSGGADVLPPVAPIPRGEKPPLSFSQQRLWFLSQMEGASEAYHIPGGLRLKGALDGEALRRALDELVSRHEALRTSFATEGGEPFQQIAPGDMGMTLAHDDLSAALDREASLRAIVKAEACAPFDLTRGPLVRARVVALGREDHVLLITMHHIVSDGWSMGVMVRELGVLYRAFAAGEGSALAPLAVQYADYAAWQRQWLSGDVLERQSAYWRETLTGAPARLDLPLDHRRPLQQDFAGDSVSLELDPELTAALKALSHRHGLTLFMTLLAGWALVLSRLSGQEDVVVGTPSANRTRLELEGLIGFFVNTLALRVDLSDSPSVAGLLERVKQAVLGAQANQNLPFEQVVELVRPERSLAHTPLFQVMFAWQNNEEVRLELPGLEAEVMAGAYGVAKFDLTLELAEVGDRIVGGLEYATSLFERSTVERFAGYLREALVGMARDPEQAASSVPLLGPLERHRLLVDWNATEAPYPSEACVHDLIEAQAAQAPEGAAVVFGEASLSYGELNAQANRLARHLMGLGVGPDTLVAICVERSLEMVVGLLAILKAGGAYVPLDPGYPAERLSFMLSDAGAKVVLSHGPARAALAQAMADQADPAQVIDLVEDAPLWAGQAAQNIDRQTLGLTSNHLAYVIYTSGSTGTPKGVMVEHQGVVNRLWWMQQTYRLGAQSVVLQKTPFGFDVSVWEFFWTLITGARLVVAQPDKHKDPAYLAELVDRESVTTLHFVPSMLWSFVDSEASANSLVDVYCSGEELPDSLVRRFQQRFPSTALHNLYGPTEASIDVTFWACTPDNIDSLSSAPIGRPISNTRIYLLDDRLEPVPVGVSGEIYIGGAGVARGYLNRPELTAERFIESPFVDGDRLYKTGDLARYLPDGNIVFLGRNDHQVKIRGFRIELGEIEARLVEHPSVREAVVLAREDQAGDKRLVAYCTAAEAGLDPEAAALRAHLAAVLPDYMVPAAYVRLESLPLTPNGKLDRKALPAPEGNAYATRAYEAPVGPVEGTLARIWAELLGVEQVGRHDSFFELGGHSLLAVRMISRVREQLDTEVALAELFAHPGLSAFAARLSSGGADVLPPVAPIPRGEKPPLSFSQQRLWFLSQMEGASEAYHIPGGLRLKGALDGEALRRALDELVSRHEALRTSFATEGGEPFQQIAPGDMGMTLAHDDLSAALDREASLRAIVKAEACAPFDLTQGPLVRARVVALGREDHVLLITMHHIVSDGWSMGVMVRELGVLYRAFAAGEGSALAPLAVQYADYAAWQRQWLSGDVLERQSAYWRETLTGAPARLDLPLDHRRPLQQDFAGDSVSLELDPELTAALKALSHRHGLTLFMTLLAGWALVLSRLSGQEDVVVGTPSANRTRLELEGLIGFFVNTLALRVDLSDSPSVAGLLERVKQAVLGAQANQNLPFEQVVELVRPERSLAHTPLFQVMFAWQNNEEVRLELPGLEAEVMAGAYGAAKFDLTLELAEVGDRIVGGLEYATSLFERSTVERFAGYLREALVGMARDPEQAASSVPLLDPLERHRLLVDWNATQAPYPDHLCVHQLFEQQVGLNPDATALVYEDQSLSYGELNAQANQLAHHLIGLGVQPDDRIAICVERSLEMVVGLIAILKAGGAYVPLDPAYPADRLAFMLADANPQIVLSHGPARQALDAAMAGLAAPPQVVDLIDDARLWTSQPDANPDPKALGLKPTNLAYVIYTSGSTGTPKGVMVEHRNVSRLFASTRGWFDFGSDDVWTLFHSFAFDFSVWEIWGALLHSGRLLVVPHSRARSAKDFYEMVRQAGVTVLNQTPSAFRNLIAAQAEDNRPHALRHVIFGGEALDVAALRPWWERSQNLRTGLVNMYGITETTVHVTYRPLSAADAETSGASPIGRPIGDLRLYLLDDRLEPVPVGVSGEIYIGGAGVARGYLNRPELTAERFIASPFVEGDRLYKTGDLARYLPDGNIVFLGRNDHQVKIRGFRIELGEIEARLLDVDGVRDAVVVAREDTPGDKRLVAYYTGEAGVEAEHLRPALLAALPDYMVPAAYVRLESLPLTPNGKLDRKALPAPEGNAYATRAYEAPVGPVEGALARIWAELLGVEQVGRHDSFFELGGHSLLAVRMISRVREQLDTEVALAELFAHPGLSAFAARLSSGGADVLPPVAPIPRGEKPPLSFSQQRLWFLSQMEGASEAYHIPGGLRLKGALDGEALRRALDELVSRHEALRTSFATEGGEPFQQIAPGDMGMTLAHDDLSAALDREASLRAIVKAEACAPFDLTQGPLVRARVVALGREDHVLLITMHHIVSDGWSMGVMVRELGVLYRAFAAGEGSALAPLAVQYADYAAWQRQWLSGDVLERQSAYWRETLTGAPARLDLPLDHRRPLQQDFAGDSVSLELDPELTAALKALSHRHGLTLFMTLLAGWALVLSRLSGQEDVVVGTPSANRTRLELEGLIGFFVNTLALRVDLSDSPSVAGLLERVKQAVLGAQANQNLPFEQVVELVRPERSLAHTPLFQVMFAWQNNEEVRLELPGLEAEVMAGAYGAAKFDLTLELAEVGDRIVGGLEYATSLFERSTVERFAGYLREALVGMARDPEQAASSVPLLDPLERHRLLVDWNATQAPYPDHLCVHQLFEQQVGLNPDATALVYEDQSLSYGELNAQANQLAHHLIGLGVQPDDRIAICVERSLEMVVGLIAILKAGGAYVPLDPAYPADRLAFMLADANPQIVLSHGPARQALDAAMAGLAAPPQVVDLIDDARLWTSQPDANPDPKALGLKPTNLAYVIYTSGSTGTPKGVMVEHRNVSRLFASTQVWFDFGSDDVWTLFHSFAFDFSVWEIWGALLHGGRLLVVPYSRARSAKDFYEMVRQAGVTVLNQTPSAFRNLIAAQAEDNRPHALRHVIFGGEALDVAALRPWWERSQNLRTGLVNMYGITETTVHVTYRPLSAADAETSGASPIGRPIGDLPLYLLDDRLEPVPVGVSGEIYIGGAGVARGYLNRPELTAERFIASPFVEGDRLYKTGDLARYLPDGNIVFLGRNDHQVKIRGFRIELGEIEARLLDVDGVRDAVVVAREDTPGDKRLVAYYTGEAGVEAEHLRPALLATLPDYMVPAAYVRLESLPLTPNGKLDRKALPAPEGNAYATRAYEAPVGPVEGALARIWAELLGVEQVGRHDNFFELGGHSLLAVRMISRVREQLDTEVALAELFAHPGLSAFAARLSGGANQTTLTDHMNAVTQISNHNVRESLAFSVPSRIAIAPSEEVNHLDKIGRSHCEIAYQIHRRKKLDVIYVHGYGEGGYVWRPILELVDHNYGAITLDLRGHGDSQWSATRKYSDATFADDIAAVVRTSGISDHVVVGHSLGAAAALAYAARHPSKLCGIVLVDYGSENHAPADLEKEPAEKPLYANIEEYYEFLKADRPLGIPNILRYYAERAVIATGAGFITKEDPHLQNLSIANGAATAITLVNASMLIIRGQYSSHLSRQQIDSMRKVHGASACEISNCGHAIMSENPSALAAQISQFLNALEAKTHSKQR